ncbi:MAG: folate-binding protein [Alphaproteobacteria bacterium]
MAEEAIRACIREDRAFLAVTGAEARPFLQGLLSQDVEKIVDGKAGYGALLTPQGKFLHDLFLTASPDGLVLECEAARVDDLALRLKRYRLRAKVTIEPMEGWQAGLAWGGDAFGLAGGSGDRRGVAESRDGAVVYLDPRLAALGARVVGPADAVARLLADLPKADLADYAAHRLALGVPEGADDIAVDRGFLLESGFDELNGVDWKKGCYVGQELTARTKYRGLVKRRLMPVRIEGGAPEVGAAIDFEGRNAGEMRSAVGARGLALVRLDAWRKAMETEAPLAAGDARLWPEKPEWARFE